MRLLFAYIERFRNYRNQSIHFVDDYKCGYENGELIISKAEVNPAKKIIFKDSVLKNLSIVVGETGSGKTNLFQLIGMDQYFRSDLKKSDSYLLLFEQEIPNRYIVEVCNLRPMNMNLHINHSDEKYGFLASYEIELDENDGHIISTVRLDKRYEYDTYIVNCFDLNAFSMAPCNDEHEDGHFNEDCVTRIVSPYGRTNIGLACEWLAHYISIFPNTSIKRCATFKIKADNWRYKLPSDLPEDVVKEQYWTYWNKRYSVTPNGKRNTVKQSPKKQFLHDLLVDYALYLRKWADGLTPVDDVEDDLWVMDQIAQRRNQYVPYLFLPDILGWGGANNEILRRIDYLGQYIDFHYDPDLGPKRLVWQITDDIKDIYEILSRFDDKYFTEDEFSLPIVDMDFSDRTLNDLFERMTAYRADEYGVFTQELLPYQIDGISSGEYQYAKTLGAVDEYCIRLKMSSTRNNKEYHQPNFILLLDEPEAYMHPELCRKFIFVMDKLLEKHTSSSKLQIIMSTHSPFMLSDVLPSQIVRLRMDDEGYAMVLPETDTPTFAGGIHSIMANEFFLKFTIGEYSRSFLSKNLKRLRIIKERGIKSDEDKTFVGEMKLVEPNIGDILIRNYFTSLLSDL